MPKCRIERFYYRNGQIRMENREVGGQLHGLCRTWHYNGQLAEEQRYHHGKSHGLSQQWDEYGHLLGSFTMNHGTGRQRYWHNNGRLKSEINSLNGKFFGRLRIWLRDGTLVQETYYISNVDVTRAAYLKAARKYPDWPQHEGEPAGKVARDDQALKRKEHELFMESLLGKTVPKPGNGWARPKIPIFAHSQDFARQSRRFVLWKRYTHPVRSPSLPLLFTWANVENNLPTGCWSNRRRRRQNGRRCERFVRIYAPNEAAHCCRTRRIWVKATCLSIWNEKRILNRGGCRLLKYIAKKEISLYTFPRENETKCRNNRLGIRVYCECLFSACG